jgi:hypothetical protein
VGAWCDRVDAASPSFLLSPSAVARVRTLLRVDAVFEFVLAVALIYIGLTGLDDDLGLPDPANTVVTAGFGVLLLPVGVALWLMARAKETPQRWFVLGLAAANGLGALVFLLWLLVLGEDFGTGGALLAGAIAVGLALLAFAEWRALRD